MSTAHRKGSAWRHAVEQWFSTAGFATSVRGIGYAGDDVLVRHPRPDVWPPLVFSVECKNHKRIDLATFVDQAVEQAATYEDELALPIAVIHRPGRSQVDDGYVVMPAWAFLELVTR